MYITACLYQEVPRAALTPVSFFVGRAPRCALPAEITSVAGACPLQLGIWHVVLSIRSGLVSTPLLLHQGKPCFKFEGNWYYANALPLV